MEGAIVLLLLAAAAVVLLLLPLALPPLPPPPSLLLVVPVLLLLSLLSLAFLPHRDDVYGSVWTLRILGCWRTTFIVVVDALY
jgi:hypothetical protein